jgi:hypothetical protein
MRLLLPAPGFPPLFYEINISEDSLAISGFDHGHRVVSQGDVRPDGEFGLMSTQILGENAVTVRAALTQTGGRAGSHRRHDQRAALQVRQHALSKAAGLPGSRSQRAGCGDIGALAARGQRAEDSRFRPAQLRVHR